MKCKECSSEWESGISMEKCPFCGANLIEDDILTDFSDISSVLQYLIAKKGKEVLLNSPVVISYIMDLVKGQERTKKLFRKGCNEGVLEKVYAILIEPKQNRQKTMVFDLKYFLVEDAFYSEKSAVELINMILKGVGLSSYILVSLQNSSGKIVSQQSAPTYQQPVYQPAPQHVQQQQTAKPTPPFAPRLNVQVGGQVQFGQYPQGANGEMQPLMWRVLAVENGRALLITDKLIDCVMYNEKLVDVTWETCTLRKWMNNDFISKAFSSSQQAQIATVSNQNPNNPKYGTKGGNATQDRIFALSIDEANKYFSSYSDRIAYTTDYAQKKGLDRSEWWWLRSPGINSSSAAFVLSNGYITRSGFDVFRNIVAVRPALWLNL